MIMFFIKLEVRPTERNSQAELVEGAVAHCWVLEESAAAAYNKASFCVWRDEWEVTESTVPVEVVEECFVESDLGREQFLKAKHQSVAIFYVAWSRDGQTAVGPSQLKRSSRFDLNAFVQAQKKFADKARCLHFDNNGRCKEFVEAHSLQKNGLLREISQNGHVYAPSRNIGTLRKNHGKLVSRF